MILDAKSTTVGYRCPVCGNGVISLVGIFALSADMLRMKCSCGKSVLTLKYDRSSDGEKCIKLSVPCLFCQNPHPFTVKPSVFFSRDLFVLPCPMTGFDIFFCGTQETVSRRMEEVRDELIELTGNKNVFDITSDDVEDEPRDEVDPHIIDIVRYGIIDMLDTGAVKCNCPRDDTVIEDVSVSDGSGDGGDGASYESGNARYSLTLDTEGGTLYATVKCNRCGASAVCEVTGIASAMRLLERDTLVLD